MKAYSSLTSEMFLTACFFENSAYNSEFSNIVIISCSNQIKKYINHSETVILFWFSVPGRDQLRKQVFMSFYLFRQETEEVETILLLQYFIDMLLSQFVEILVCQGLGCVESLFWRIDHDL